MKDLPPQYISYRRSIIYGVLAGFGLALVFFAGFFVRDFVDLPPQIAAAVQSDDTYPLLNEVQALIDQSYLRDQPDYAQRQYGAVRGMLATLNDRYTFFIDPPVAASESQVLAGTYGGIGVQLRRNEAGQFILFPLQTTRQREPVFKMEIA
jgi:carboxyl-terminal processing protease